MGTLAERIRSHFLWLLLASYVVSVLVPTPGRWLARWDLAEGLGGSGMARFPLLLVAVLLYLAACHVDLSELRVVTRRPWLMVACLATAWLLPTVAVAIFGLMLPTGWAAGSSLLLGLALVAAMPVANSSVGWTQQSGGNLAWGLSLVVLSILLCPWITPWLLQIAGMALSAGEAAQVEELVKQLSSWAFIVWVLLPTALGLLTRRLLGKKKITAFDTPVRLTTAATLLTLNYVNGTIALPKFFSHPQYDVLLVALGAALVLSLLGVFAARGLAEALRLDRSTRLALRYGLSMKHTGLALGLAGSILVDQPLAILPIIIATPTQHLVASVVDRIAQRSGGELPLKGESSPS